MDVALFTVTVISLTMAFAMGIVTWRLLREERRRADARVASLMAELERVRAGRQKTGSRPAPPAAPVRRPPSDPPTPPRHRGAADTVLGPAHTELPDGVTPPPGLLAAEEEIPTAGRPLLVAAALGVVIAAIAIGALWPSADSSAAPPTSQPVELLSLDHTREGEFLAIRGAIRNPADGVERRELSVTATVFDRDGEVVGQGQTPLEVEVLAPGAEIPFTIAVPDADRINRYRVSFMQAENSLPHVDRRLADGPMRAGIGTAGDQP